MVKSSKLPKKVQVDKSKTAIFAAVSVASIFAVASLMICRGLWSQTSYLGRVADTKEAAVKQLEENKAAIGALKQSYDGFVSQSPNMLGGNPEGNSDRDGDNANLVLDALPAKFDFPAVASSLEKLLFGYTINSVSGSASEVSPAATVTDPNAAASPNVTADSSAVAMPDTGVTEIPFAVEVTTNYQGFRQLIGNFNRSIRPFYMTNIVLMGTNDELSVTLTGKTFYQLERGLDITQVEVQ